MKKIILIFIVTFNFANSASFLQNTKNMFNNFQKLKTDKKVFYILSFLLCNKALCDTKTITMVKHKVGNLETTLPQQLVRVIKYLKNQSLDEDVRLPNRLILHGPPGNGKSTLAREIANEWGASFIPLDGPSVVNAYVGSGPKTIKETFVEAYMAAPHQKFLIFIDEIDAIANNNTRHNRDRSDYIATIQQIWLSLDLIKNKPNIFVIFATNKFNTLDRTFVDRFDKTFGVIEITNPDGSRRKEAIELNFKKNKINLPEQDKIEIVKKTKGLNIRNIENLTTCATLIAEQDHQGKISKNIFLNEIQTYKQAQLNEKKYDKESEDYKSAESWHKYASIASVACSLTTILYYLNLYYKNRN